MKRLIVLLGIILLVFPVFSEAQELRLGQSVQVPTPEGEYTMPSFSPDSGSIAFARKGYDGLYVIDRQGQVNTISEAPLSGWRYAWGPDGNNLAYRMRYGDSPALAGMVSSLDGSMQTQVTDWQNDLFPPQWDKNGIGFKSGDDFLTVDADGKVKAVKSLSDGRGTVSRAIGLSASFFANNLAGASLSAFAALIPAASGKSSGKDIYTDPDNQLCVVDENGETKKLLDIEDESGYTSPEMAPTGDLVAAPGLSGQLYIAGMAGGDPVRLGEGQNPTWSPDGRLLIYEVAKDNGHEFTASDLWIASADGSWKRQLTNTQELERYPSWSPDGRYIVYEIDGKIFYAPVERSQP